jgi:hypothetical protein
MKTTIVALFLCLLAAPSPAHAADEPLPYTEGSVWHVELIKVKAGLWEEYVRTLTRSKKVLDEAKKQKLILSYKMISSEAATPQDWSLMLLVEYKNMAALDGLQEKMRAIAGGVVGDEKARTDLAVKRLDMREIVGDKTGRELLFK